MTDYQCSKEHTFSAPTQPKKCPHCIEGAPCSGKVSVVVTGAAAQYEVCDGSNQRVEHDGRKGTDKGKCPVCGKRVKVKKNGTLYVHGKGSVPTKALAAKKAALPRDRNGLSANDRAAIKEVSDLLAGRR